MFGLGSLVGGALKLGGSIFGGIKASRAMSKAYDAVNKSIMNQKDENQNWYDRRYNEDATQRADAQRMLAMTMDAIRDRSMASKGSQAVMGGTEEAAAADKAANAKMYADTAAQIAVAGANRKDDIENQFRERNANLEKQLNDLTMQQATQKAQNIQKMVGDATNTASSIVGDSDMNKIRLFG